MPKVTREYHVDLGQPASRRWERIIRAEKESAKKLIRACIGEASIAAGKVYGGTLAFKLARKLTARIYERRGAPLGEDIDAWASGSEISREDLIFSNLCYEVAQVAVFRSVIPYNPLGCTAAAFNLPNGQGVAHVRNMDWPMTGCGPETVVIHYTGNCGAFTTVGWPGYVGVLSGIAPGRFSATINQAPQIRSVRPRLPPSFALRQAFENCKTFDAAVEFLAKAQLAASVFFLVAGTEADQAVVIEHTGREAFCRRMHDGALAVANHYVWPKYAGNNYEIQQSDERLPAALAAAKAAKSNIPEELFSLLNCEPVLRPLTAQQMAFVPRTGEYHASFRDTDAAVKERLSES